MKVGLTGEALTAVGVGINTYTYNLVKELIKLYKDIYLIEYSPDNVFNNIPKIIVPNPFQKFSRIYLWHPYLALKLNFNEYPLDIVHSLNQGPGIFKLKKQRYIITVHDLLPIVFPRVRPLKVVLVYKFLIPRALKTADAIIAVSYNTKRDIIKYFKIPEEKIRVIYNGVNENYKPLSEKEVEKIHQKYDINYPFILYVGRLAFHKNIPTLLKAFYKLKKYNLPHKLIIIGKKDWKYKDIFDLVDRLNLHKDVIFLGYVPNEDLPALYNAADLFVYPSLYEGFGLPPLEAMACGTPVVTSNTSSLPEVVGDAGIMVEPYDVDGFAKAMYEILTNDGLREELRKKGLKRAKLFNWRKTAEETLEVYEEVYNR